MNEQLERALAGRFDRGHCVLVGSGTAALFCAFELLRLKSKSRAGSSILFPNVTCETAVNAAVFAGYTPVFCDVRSDDALISTASVLSALAAHDVAAIVPTHMYGHIVDVAQLQRDLGTEVAVIEDAAQGYGGELRQQKVGSMGNASVLSFGAGKLLDCGGGGALLCDDSADAEGYREIAAQLPADETSAALHRTEVMKEMMAARKALRHQRASLIEQQGLILRSHRSGYLARCQPQHAAAIQAQLANIEAAAKEREELMWRLDDILRDVPGVTLPERNGRPVLWRYTFNVDAGGRDARVNALKSAGLAVSKLFPPCAEKFSAERQTLPVSEHLATTVVNVHFPVAASQYPMVIEAVRHVFG